MNNLDNTSNETIWDKIKDRILLCLYSIERVCGNLKFTIRSYYQKITKGYSDYECWNLKQTICHWMLPRLKFLRDNLHSMPPNLENSSEPQTYLTIEEWRNILDKMIYAFEFPTLEDKIVDDCYPNDYKWGWKTSKPDENGKCHLIFNDDRIPDFSNYEECFKKQQEGLRLFQLYFNHLWD